MKRLDTNVGSFDRPFQERPKVLQPVRVDRAIDICFGVVDYLMRVLIKAVIGLQRISVQFRSRCNVLTNLAVKVVFAPTCRQQTCGPYRSPDQAGQTRFALPSVPRPWIFSARLLACIFRALPPIKVSSASTVPVILLMVRDAARTGYGAT
jgi:hypothetical protein